MSADQQSTARMTAASSSDSSRFSFRRPKKKKTQTEHGQTPTAYNNGASGSFSKPRPTGSRPSAAPPSSSSRRNRSHSPTQKKKPSKSRPAVTRTNSQIMMVSRDYSIEAATEEFRQAGLRRKTASQPSVRMAASERLRLREILMARGRGDDSSDDEEGKSPGFDVADSSIYRGEAVLRFRELLNDDNLGDLDASEPSLSKKPEGGGRSGRRRGRRPSRRRSMSFDDKDAAAFLLAGLKGGDGRPDNDNKPDNNERPDDSSSPYSSGQFKNSLKSSGKLFDEKVRLALEKKERNKLERKSSKRVRRKGSLLSKDKSRRGRDDSAVDRSKVQRSRRRSMSCDDKEVAAFLKLKEDRQNRSSETSCPSSVEGHNMSSNSLVEDSGHTLGSDRSRKSAKSSKRERRKSGLVKVTSRRRTAERGAAPRSRRRSMSCDDKDVAAYLRGRGELSNNSSVEEEEEETRAVTRRPFAGHDHEPPARPGSSEYDREIMLERQSEERQRIERERNTTEQAERVAQRRFERWKRRSQMGMQQQFPVADDGGCDGESSGGGTTRRSLSDPDMAGSTLGDSTLTRDAYCDDDDVRGDMFGDGGPPPVHRPSRPGPGLYNNRRGTIDQHALVNFVRSPGLDDIVMDDDRPMSRLYEQIMPRDSLAPNGATSAQSPGGGDHSSVLNFSTMSMRGSLHDSTQHSDEYSQRFSMDEYIQLKMSVAELRSELQEAHNLTSRYQNRLKEVEVDRQSIEKKNKMLMGIVVGAVKEGKLSVSVLKGLKD